MTIGVFAFGGFALAQMPHDAVRTAGSGQVGVSYINDLTVSVGGGDLDVTLPFNTSPLKNNDGSVAIGVRMAMTVTKPDASTVSYKQLTDADGRIRGQIYDSVIDQTGTYTIQVQVDGGGPSDSANFLIRERAQLDRDGQIFTGDNQTFRNAANSATAFRVQNAAGTTILNVDTLTGMVTLANLTVSGTCTGCGAGGSGDLQDAYDNGNTITSTNSRNIAFDLDDTAVDSDFIVDIQGSGNTIEFQDGGTAFATFADGGSARFKNTVDSAAGFDVQDAAGTSLLTVDTVAGQVEVVDLVATGTVTAAGFTGDGSALTGVDADTLGGQAGSFYQDADNLNAGTVDDARLSANVTLAGNTFNGANQLVQLDGSGALPALNGAALTNLNASNVSSGTLSDGRLSTNVALENVANSFSQAQTIGVAGKTALQLSSNGVDTGITIGADTNLYRSSANNLMTDDAFTASGSITSASDLHAQGALIVDAWGSITGNLTVNESINVGALGYYAASGVEDTLNIRGTVEGSTGNMLLGLGYFSQYLGTGVYSITFDTAFADVPSPVVTAVDPVGVVLCHPHVVTVNDFIITCKNTAGTAIDQNFNFQVAGPRPI